jgi:hypothetical protein
VIADPESLRDTAAYARTRSPIATRPEPPTQFPPTGDAGTIRSFGTTSCMATESDSASHRTQAQRPRTAAAGARIRYTIPPMPIAHHMFSPIGLS